MNLFSSDPNFFRDLGPAARSSLAGVPLVRLQDWAQHSQLKAIGVGQSLGAADLVQIFRDPQMRHLVQKDALAWEHDLIVSGGIVKDPSSYFSRPAEGCLLQCEGYQRWRV